MINTLPEARISQEPRGLGPVCYIIVKIIWIQTNVISPFSLLACWRPNASCNGKPTCWRCTPRVRYSPRTVWRGLSTLGERAVGSNDLRSMYDLMGYEQESLPRGKGGCCKPGRHGQLIVSRSGGRGCGRHGPSRKSGIALPGTILEVSGI